jgi:hypothetical protein
VSTASPDKQRLLESPQKQRRLLWIASAFLVVAVATLLIVFMRNTRADNAKETFSDDPAQIFTQPQTVSVDPAARKVAGRFILTAVARHDLAASYDLTHPDLRRGFTRAQWKTGNIPVIPFPASDLDFASFKVEYSFPTEVVLNVLLVPASTQAKPAGFYIGLKRAGKDGPWRVYYWAPNSKPAVPDPAAS